MLRGEPVRGRNYLSKQKSAQMFSRIGKICGFVFYLLGNWGTKGRLLVLPLSSPSCWRARQYFAMHICSNISFHGLNGCLLSLLKQQKNCKAPHISDEVKLLEVAAMHKGLQRSARWRKQRRWELSHACKMVVLVLSALGSWLWAAALK